MKRWVKQCEEYERQGVLGSSEWASLTTLAMESKGTELCWESALKWFENEPEKGQFILWVNIRGALTYDGVPSPKEALAWKTDLQETLNHLELLIGATPPQYHHWRSNHAAIDAARLKQVMSDMGMTLTESDWEIIATLNDPCDRIASMQKAIRTAKYEQGCWPPKTDGEYSKRNFFIRSLSASLKPLSDDWEILVRNLAMAIFELDLKRAQVLAIGSGVPANRRLLDCIDFLYRANLK